MNTYALSNHKHTRTHTHTHTHTHTPSTTGRPPAGPKAGWTDEKRLHLIKQ